MLKSIINIIMASLLLVSSTLDARLGIHNDDQMAGKYISVTMTCQYGGRVGPCPDPCANTFTLGALESKSCEISYPHEVKIWFKWGDTNAISATLTADPKNNVRVLQIHNPNGSHDTSTSPGGAAGTPVALDIYFGNDNRAYPPNPARLTPIWR